MNDKERLAIYERNQCKLIKALTNKIKECKELEKNNTLLANLCVYYGTFLNTEQIHASQLLAEAMTKKEFV